MSSETKEISLKNGVKISEEDYNIVKDILKTEKLVLFDIFGSIIDLAATVVYSKDAIKQIKVVLEEFIRYGTIDSFETSNFIASLAGPLWFAMCFGLFFESYKMSSNDLKEKKLENEETFNKVKRMIKESKKSNLN